MTAEEFPKVRVNYEIQKSKKENLPTLDEIKSSIPKHCFERNLTKSIFYLIRDFIQLFIWYLLFPTVEKYFGFIGLIVYYWIFGMLSFALFVVGHDCGHGSFSEYQWLNDIFGHICHAPLMVPYWPWQKSHNRHHSFTSHVDKDMGHPWFKEEHYVKFNFFLKHWHKIILITGFILWLPVYLILGYTDGSHYWPFSKLFKTNKERLQCFISSSACILCAYISYLICQQDTYLWIKYFWIPILMNGFWLTMVTYLQHRDDDIEVYEDGTWTYVKGQLQTIDRVYGFGIETLCHHITDGHIAHHMFFKQIPHYHLIEATDSIKKLLNSYDKNLYRIRDSRDYLLKYIILNMNLKYLVSIKTGILRFVGYESC